MRNQLHHMAEHSKFYLLYYLRSGLHNAARSSKYKGWKHRALSHTELNCKLSTCRASVSLTDTSKAPRKQIFNYFWYFNWYISPHKFAKSSMLINLVDRFRQIDSAENWREALRHPTINNITNYGIYIAWVQPNSFLNPNWLFSNLKLIDCNWWADNVQILQIV